MICDFNAGMQVSNILKFKSETPSQLYLVNRFEYYIQENINIYNITDLFCDELLCIIGENDRSFYHDVDHLSTYGVLKLEKVIEEILLKK